MTTTVSYGLNPELACAFLALGGLIVGQMIRLKKQWREKKAASPEPQ